MRRLLVVGCVLAVAGCGLLRKPAGNEALQSGSAAGEPIQDVVEPVPKAAGALATKGAAVAVMPSAPAPAAGVTVVRSGLDTGAIEEATGLTGATMSDGVFRITKPRGDLKVTLEGFPITPRMGLAGWVGFRSHASGAMLRGVMPVAADELQAVVSALANAGLEPTAIHPHFVGEEPRIAFVHFGGVGSEIALARGVRDVLDAIVRARAARPAKAAATEAHSDLDVARLDTALGLHGELDGLVYRVTAARSDVRVSEHGVDLGSTMSPTSWAAFQGSAERAAVAGELMVQAAEVQAVIHALRESRIAVVGIHDESLRDEPHIAFVSFWGVGRLDALAAGVRKALDQLPRGG